MKRQYVYTLALSAALLSTAACRKDIPEPVIPDDQKGLIVLSMSDEAAGAGTKAGFSAATKVVARISSTDGSNTRHTRTMMEAKADATQTVGSTSAVDYAGDEYKRYWDDAFGRKAKLSVYAIAVPGNNSTSLEGKLIKGNTDVDGINTAWKTDPEDNNVSWTVATQQTVETLSNEDLCYSNNIQDKNKGGHDGRLVYADTGYPSFEYKDHDNSCTHSEFQHDFYPTLTDGQMMFKLDDENIDDGPGHFDRGHMIFRHALTRITIELIGGEGFDYGNSSSFTFNPQSGSDPASIALLNVNTSGKLNIQSGEWSGQQTSQTYMSCSEKASGEVNFAKGKTIYTLTAQIIPGNTVQNGITDNFLSFNIDDNNYYVTQDMVFDALNTEANKVQNTADGSTLIKVEDGKITFEQGKNYKFKITVNKTGIKAITCSLVNWKDVKAEFTPSNAYITFGSLTPITSDHSEACKHFDLYRILNENNTITSPDNMDFDGDPQYMTGYTDYLSTDGDNPGITEVSTGSTYVWKTTWFFESNKTFYHFRSVNPGTKIFLNETDGDYFTMYSGPVNDEYSNTDLPAAVGDGKYNDYHWGAIYQTGTTLKYDAVTGFESQLAGPIGPTNSRLNIIEQHMMSNINIYLLTPATSGGDYTTASVDLYDETKEDPKVSEIELTNYAGFATVRMGTGLITPTETYTPSSRITTPSHTNGEYGNSDNQEGYYLNKKTFQFPNSSDNKYYNISKAYTYRVVPQALVVGNNKVGLQIHTPDENIYYVVEDLSKITVSSVEGNDLKNDHANGSFIDRWYPGYSYNYYFVLTKKGIEAITCTIVDYVDVNANGFDIDLES